MCFCELEGISVVPSLPCGETRKSQNEAREKTQRVVISDVEEDSIKEITGTAEVRRIFKRGVTPNEKTPTTTVILIYRTRPNQGPDRLSKF